MKKQTRNQKSKKHPIAHNVRASLLHVAPHTSTGKKLPRRQTSHGFLLLFLVAAGVMMFALISAMQAAGLTQQITATVPGNAPTKGATIKTPSNKTATRSSVAAITGTCQTQTIVAMYNNGQFAGSTPCDSSESFQTNVQLITGTNVLQAQNYDVLNQAGPVTEQVAVVLEEVPLVNTTAPTVYTPDSSITYLPAPQPATNPCYDEPSALTGDQLGLSVSCIIRNVPTNQEVQLPIVISGGVAPYALSIDWGDDTPADLRSFNTAGSYTVAHAFSIPKTKTIHFKLADSAGTSYAIQTVVDIDGNPEATTNTPAAPASTNPLDVIAGGGTGSNVLDITVPLYWGVVVLVLGFWIGDVFHRYISVKRPTTKRRRA